VQLNFRGYFDLYNIPFDQIALYDFSEKKSPLQPGGMNRGPNIFDHLQQNRIAYHVSAPEADEQVNLRSLIQDIEAEQIDFAFLYWPGLDGLLHRVGNQSAEVPAKLRSYESWTEQLLAVARRHYQEVRLYVFSDHGMANCTECLDLKSRIEALPLSIPADYAAVYDSTMARFWFFNERARWLITDSLKQVSVGRIVPDAELERLHAFFPDRYFGELVFLVKEGVLIVPSHMGERPITGMHGYHPDDPHSYAMLCTNQPEIPDEVQAIPDVYRLMQRDADLAKAMNASNSNTTVEPTVYPNQIPAAA
jgi:predicted AlkP superfamily pyrophosphatase or phosphodiesterase